MSANNNQLGSEEYDKFFSQINGLTWLPWIGENYSRSSKKILFIAESHYTKGDDEQIEKAKENLTTDSLLTRKVVSECPINHDWQNNMFDNLHRCLVGTTEFDTKKLWDEVAFYNFIQKPMDYNGEQWEKERPSKKDFLHGWSIFIEIIKILKPTDCIFIGVSASNTFDQYMDYNNVKYSPVKWIEGQGAYGRKFSLSLNDYCLNCVGIKHTSKFFSWDFWNRFLRKYSSEAMKFMQHLVNTPIPTSIDIAEKIQIDNTWGKDVPIRKHKPIIACKYNDFDEYGDAHYITIGKAQYDNENDVSVKVWRWDDKNTKWSRQSEELPISRVFDVAAMLASTIRIIQSGRSANPSTLGEEVLNEDEISFLEMQINNRSQHIKQSILNLKTLINDIDIDAI